MSAEINPETEAVMRLCDEVYKAHHGETPTSHDECPSCEVLAQALQTSYARGRKSLNEKTAELESHNARLIAAMKNLILSCPAHYTKSTDAALIVAQRVLDESPAVSLTKVRTEAIERRLREIAEWFRAWKDMPASYARAADALDRLADEESESRAPRTAGGWKK